MRKAVQLMMLSGALWLVSADPRWLPKCATAAVESSHWPLVSPSASPRGRRLVRGARCGPWSRSAEPQCRDRIQTPMILGIAFMEALAIYALVIAFFLQGKV